MPEGPEYLSDEGGAPQQTSQGFPVLSRELGRRGANPMSMALAQRSLMDREHMSAQRLDLSTQKMELEKVHELAEIEKEKLRVQDTMEHQRQVMQATRQLASLDPLLPNYESELLRIRANNPAAANDPVIVGAINYRRQLSMHQQQAGNELKLHRQAQAAAAASHLGVNPIYTAEGDVDYDKMEKLAGQGFKDVSTTPNAGITAPEGMETAKIEVNPRGERTVTFERPLRTAEKKEHLSSILEETQALGLPLDALENKGLMQTDPAKPDIFFYRSPDTSKPVVTVQKSHYNNLKAKYDALVGIEEPAPADQSKGTGGSSSGGEEPKRLKFNPATKQVE